jgi:RND family efflux transporter MFP subunit
VGRRAGLMAMVLACASPVRAEAVDCLVTPSAQVDLVFAVPGLISQAAADRGTVVHKGDVLARLDSSVEEVALRFAEERAKAHAAIDAAQARLDAATKSLERVQSLADKGLAPQSDADLARLERDQAANELRDRQETQAAAALEIERNRALLDQRRLYSPIDGVVVDRLAEVGEFVDRQPVFRIARIDPLHVEVIAPDSAFGRVHIGDRLDVTLQNPNSHVTAEVSVVDPFVDAASGTFRIRLDLPNPKGEITAGFRCNLDLPTG